MGKELIKQCLGDSGTAGSRREWRGKREKEKKREREKSNGEISEGGWKKREMKRKEENKSERGNRGEGGGKGSQKKRGNKGGCWGEGVKRLTGGGAEGGEPINKSVHSVSKLMSVINFSSLSLAVAPPLQPQPPFHPRGWGLRSAPPPPVHPPPPPAQPRRTRSFKQHQSLGN